MVPQDVTERLLVEELGRKGGAVEYETTFVSPVDQGDYISVTMDRKCEPIKLTTSFVVGCDGAHSAVRHLLNLPFEGAEYDDSFMLADIETNETLPADEMQLCPSELGPVAIFPMSATRRRIVATIENTAGDAPSLDLVRKILVQRAEAARQLAGSFSGRVELRLTSGNNLFLVRPDGYIAYSGHSHDAITALKSVRSVLEHQTN